MLVSDEYELVFVHIQKTGGMSVEAVLRKHVPDLRQVCSRHEHLRRVPPELAAEWSGYYKFAFVRNPWDRLVSWYAMIQREYQRLALWQRLLRRKPLRMEIWNLAVPYLGDFERFVRDCTDEVLDDGCLKSFAYNQLDYIENRDGSCGVDHVGRYENLQTDLNLVLDRLGLPATTLPHENRSEHAPYAHFYDATTRKIIEERFARDIDRFGYVYEAVES